MLVKKNTILFFIFLLYSADAISQFRIRLLSDESPVVVFFTVIKGVYRINPGTDKEIKINQGEAVILTRLNNRLVVKTRNESGFTCDSVEFIMTGTSCSFSLRTSSGSSLNRFYNGNLICKYDLGSVFLINTPDAEDYLAGVVKSEGGNGGSLEYFKTQAVIARTYSYKYENKHINDKYNLCDGVHCQVYQGITNDTLIIRAVMETKGEVIADEDSALIISAFHSNCGGETAASEDVWLTDQPYLKKVIDPYCLSSRNATWEKRISVEEWGSYLKKNGFTATSEDASVYNFIQNSRQVNYIAGTFTFPLNSLRNDFQLRSTYFSVKAEGDSLILNGRGYGHGVGLCQEGAMAMAKKGINYKQIIRFYYTGVQIINITDVKHTGDE